MKDLLNIIRDRLKGDTTLSYLRWVEILDDEEILPEGFDFPGVGLKDSGLNLVQMHFTKQDEDLSIRVISFVILLRGVGSSVMGDTTLPANKGKGVLDIGVDIKTSLKFDKDTASSTYKTSLENAGFFSLLPPSEEASQTLISPGGDRLVQKQALNFIYRRRVNA